MTNSLKMPIRVNPIQGESLPGYLARVAESNYLPSTGVLYDALGLDSAGLVTKLLQARENLADISNILSIAPTKLHAMIPEPIEDDADSILLNGLELRAHHFARRYRRVSPAALSVSPHHRFSWLVGALSYCPESWDLLIDQCPNPECFSYLGWNPKMGVHICEQCGFDLRHAKAEKIRFEDRPTLRLLADLFSIDELENQRALMQLHPSLRQLNRGVLLQLVILFGRCEAATRGFTNTREKKYMLSYPDLQVTGMDILLRYPKSIAEIVAKEADQLRPQFFHRMRAQLEMGFSKSTCEVVKQIITELRPLSQATIKGLCVLRQEYDCLTLRDVAEMLKVDNMAVRRLVSGGVLSPQRVRGDRRQTSWFRRAEIEELSQDLENRISTDVVTSRYGLPFTAIEQLVDAGMLRWHPSPAVRFLYLGSYLIESEFNDFIARLAAISPRQGVIKNTRMKLTECFAMVGPSPKPWAPIVELALRGALQGGLGLIDVEKGFRASNLNVDYRVAVQIQQGLIPWLPLDEPRRHYCLCVEAEERLACNPCDLTGLFSSGRLKRVLPNSPKVRRETVIETAAELISSREIGARIGVTPNHVKKWARRQGLAKVPGLAFWKRSDVEMFLPPMLYLGRTQSDFVTETLVETESLSSEHPECPYAAE